MLFRHSAAVCLVSIFLGACGGLAPSTPETSSVKGLSSEDADVARLRREFQAGKAPVASDLVTGRDWNCKVLSSRQGDFSLTDTVVAIRADGSFLKAVGPRIAGIERTQRLVPLDGSLGYRDSTEKETLLVRKAADGRLLWELSFTFLSPQFEDYKRHFDLPVGAQAPNTLATEYWECKK